MAVGGRLLGVSGGRRMERYRHAAISLNNVKCTGARIGTLLNYWSDERKDTRWPERDLGKGRLDAVTHTRKTTSDR